MRALGPPSGIPLPPNGDPKPLVFGGPVFIFCAVGGGPSPSSAIRDMYSSSILVLSDAIGGPPIPPGGGNLGGGPPRPGLQNNQNSLTLHKCATEINTFSFC